ncbi:Srb4 protein [Martiniozyma asiatica (nom. inval.)]|nr:Srb4 protein [Martiniozyma asiatica]
MEYPTPTPQLLPLDKSLLPLQPSISHHSLPNESIFSQIVKPDYPQPETTETEDNFTALQTQLVEKVHHAVNSAAMASDFVSLLVSGSKPAAQNTMSPYLKQHVRPGSLSTSDIKLPDNENKETEEKIKVALMGRGWKLDALKNSAAKVKEACQGLKTKIETERNYWDDLLGLVNSGEIITKVGSEIGVKYGYGDSGSLYFDKGVGVLKKGSDGHFVFEKIKNTEREAVWASERMVVVNLYIRGVLVGRSRTEIPEGCKSDDVIGEIKKSRFWLFENELWWNLVKESTGLIAYDVQLIPGDSLVESTIKIVTPNVVIEFQTALVDTSNNAHQLPKDEDANDIAFLLRMLICAAHRRNQLHKQLPPVSMNKDQDRSDPRDKYGYLIRPLLLHIKHKHSLSELKHILTQVSPDAEFLSHIHVNSPSMIKKDPMGKIYTSFAPQSKISLKSEISITVKVISRYDTIAPIYFVQVKGPRIQTAEFTDLPELEEWVTYVYNSQSETLTKSKQENTQN